MKILYLFLSAIIPHDFVLLVLMKYCSWRARFQFLIKKIYFFLFRYLMPKNGWQGFLLIHIEANQLANGISWLIGNWNANWLAMLSYADP